jgi:hypothetical protein
MSFFSGSDPKVIPSSLVLSERIPTLDDQLGALTLWIQCGDKQRRYFIKEVVEGNVVWLELHKQYSTS